MSPELSYNEEHWLRMIGTNTEEKMSDQMEMLENNQDINSRLAEREKDLIEAISLLQLENDRLREQIKMLNDGSCLDKLNMRLNDALESNKVLAERATALSEENLKLSQEIEEEGHATAYQMSQRKVDAQTAIDHDKRCHEVLQLIQTVLSAWRHGDNIGRDEEARLKLVISIIDEQHLNLGWLSTYSDGTLRDPDDDIPF